MGAPLKSVDFEKLSKLCKYPLATEDIVSLLNIANDKKVSYDTVVRRLKEEFGKSMTFEDFKQQKLSSFRYSILAKQIELAQKGNVTMLIWLGKQYLSQSDKLKDEITISYPEPTVLKLYGSDAAVILGKQDVSQVKELKEKNL